MSPSGRLPVLLAWEVIGRAIGEEGSCNVDLEVKNSCLCNIEPLISNVSAPMYNMLVCTVAHVERTESSSGLDRTFSTDTLKAGRPCVLSRRVLFNS